MTYQVQLRSIGPGLVHDDYVIVIEAGIATIKEATRIARKFRQSVGSEYIVQIDTTEFRFSR